MTFSKAAKKVVLDVETTGFGKTDRIIEVSALTVDPISLTPIDEYDTLVNPERDIGNSYIHGITASMVTSAPTFAEIAPALARRLDGAILIGHNVAFDAWMLLQEFNRLGDLSSFDPGLPVCTYKAAGVSLEEAGKQYLLTNESMHRALTDARITAELAAIVVDDDTDCRPAFCMASGDPNPRTLRRGAIDPTKAIKRKVSAVDSPWNGDRSGMYRYVLNYVLDDGRIDPDERAVLRDLADELQLSESQVREICRLHLATLIAASERDGVVDKDERKRLEMNANAMGLGDEPLPEMTDLPEDTSVAIGMNVCFSGNATQIHPTYSREYLEQLAVLARMEPRPSVTKALDILVLADIRSASGKARTARKYGIRVISVERFIHEIGADV